MDALFELVQSLSASEKRYFSRSAQFYASKTTQDYYQLFTILDNLPAYNEAAIRAQHSNPVFTENLSVSKNYLYNQILQSLRNYHHKNSAMHQLYSLLEDIHILLDKNLIKQVRKRIDKAKKVAQRYQADHILIEILRIERHIIRGYVSNRADQPLAENQEKTAFHLQQLNLKFEIMELYDEVYFNLRNRTDPSETARRTKAILSRFSKKITNQYLSFETKMVYHLIWVNYYAILSKNVEQSKANMKVILDTFSEHPQFIDEYPLRYINVVNNYLNLFYLENDFSAFPKYLTFLDKIKAKSEYIRLKLFQTNYYLKFLEPLGKHDYQAAKSIIPPVEKGLKSYEKAIDKNFQFEFFQNLVIIYFFNKDYLNAKKWIKRVAKEKKHDIRQDVRLFCRLWNCLIFYEQKEYDEAYTAVQNLLRTMKKNTPQDIFYRSFLMSFFKIIGAISKRERHQLLNDLNATLATEKGYINGKKELLFWIQQQL